MAHLAVHRVIRQPVMGLFDQFDVIAALGCRYLPHRVRTRRYSRMDNSAMARLPIIYNAGTGEVAIDAPVGVELSLGQHRIYRRNLHERGGSET